MQYVWISKVADLFSNSLMIADYIFYIFSIAWWFLGNFSIVLVLQLKATWDEVYFYKIMKQHMQILQNKLFLTISFRHICPNIMLGGSNKGSTLATGAWCMYSGHCVWTVLWCSLLLRKVIVVCWLGNEWAIAGRQTLFAHCLAQAVAPWRAEQWPCERQTQWSNYRLFLSIGPFEESFTFSR